MRKFIKKSSFLLKFDYALGLAGCVGIVIDVRSEVDVLDAIFDLAADGFGFGHTVATEAAIAGVNQR